MLRGAYWRVQSVLHRFTFYRCSINFDLAFYKQFINQSMQKHEFRAAMHKPNNL